MKYTHRCTNPNKEARNLRRISEDEAVDQNGRKHPCFKGNRKGPHDKCSWLQPLV